MTGHDTRRDQIADLIDDGLSRIYGTFVDSTTPGQLAHLLAPLVMPILDAAVAEARAETARQILHELEVAQARAIRHNDWRTACTNEVRKAFVTCQHIARQHGDGGSDG